MGQKVHPLGFRLGVTQQHQCQWFSETKDYPKTVYQDFVLRNCLLNNFKKADITHIDIERSVNQVVIKVVAARSRLLTSNINTVTEHLNLLLKLMIRNPLISANALANTNITTGSLNTLNKWNGKIARSFLNTKSLFTIPEFTKNLTLNSSATGETVVEDVDPFAIKASLEKEEKQSFFENEPRLILLVGSSSQETISNSAFLTAKTIQEQLEKRVPFRRAVKVALRRGVVPKGIKIQVSGRLNGAEIARSEWTRQGRVPLHTLRAQVDYCSHQAKTQYGILGIKVWIFKGYKE